MSPEFVSTRPLLDKLGVKPGARVAVVDLDHVQAEEDLADDVLLSVGHALSGASETDDTFGVLVAHDVPP